VVSEGLVLCTMYIHMYFTRGNSSTSTFNLAG
jgi:hypothetical protein